MRLRAAVLTLLLAPIGACGQRTPDASAAAQAAGGPAPASWPTSLKPVGDGFPASGDPCRRVGESAATIELLDDSASLVGCPTAQAAAKLGGRVVATIDGITLVSVPRNAAAATGDRDDGGDAKVAGTSYHATADIPCRLPKATVSTCPAGVTRGPDQIAVEVKLPGGATRVLLFDGKGAFVTHGSAQSNGSAALTSKARRDEDWAIVTVGGEEYRLPDAFLTGD